MSTTKFTIKAALGKRKLTSILSDNLRSATMSVTLGGRHTEAGFQPQLNCWIKDEDEREAGMVINRESLMALRKLLVEGMTDEGFLSQ